MFMARNFRKNTKCLTSPEELNEVFSTVSSCKPISEFYETNFQYVLKVKLPKRDLSSKRRSKLKKLVI